MMLVKNRCDIVFGFVPEVNVTSPSISISTSFDTTTNDTNLICWLDGFSPKGINVTWGAGNKGTERKFKNEENKKFAMLSQISINAEQWKEGKEFTCSATHKSKTFNQTWSICKGHLNSEPRIRLEKPALRSILTDTRVTVSCVVETVFQPKVLWLVDGSTKSDTDIISERQGESTVSNLTISVEDWTKSNAITCRAEHPCFKTIEYEFKTTEKVQKTPTVEIRRSLEDIRKGNILVLECAASGLPSGELSVTFQANDDKFPETQYVNLPKGQETLTARFTIPKINQTKDNNFACQIQQSRSLKWKSNSIRNLFDAPSVELSVLSSEDKSASTTLLCSATGFNPVISWGHGGRDSTVVTMQEDGRVKRSSKLLVLEQDWNRGTTYTCQVSDQSSSTNIQKSTSVCEGHPNSKPRIRLEKPALRSILTDTHVTVSCVVETVFQPKVSWFRDGNKIINTGINSERQGESTVSNLTISAEDWTKWKTITCRAEHPCFQKIEDKIKTTENVQKTPTVEIRRSLEDIRKGNILVLECSASGLPSGELSVTFQANDVKFPETQYVNLPKGQETLTARFTIPKINQTKDNNFACQIQQSRSLKWKSNSIRNLFGGFLIIIRLVTFTIGLVIVAQLFFIIIIIFFFFLINITASLENCDSSLCVSSVELSVVSSENKFASMTQKLLCTATGLNPEIKWLPESEAKSKSEASINADGHVKVSSELPVPEQEWKPGTTFTCQVSDPGRQTVQKNIGFCAVTPDHARKAQVYLLRPSVSDMLEKKSPHVSVTFLLLGQRVQDFAVNCKIGEKNLTNVIKTEKHGNGTESGRMVLNVLAESWNNHSTVFCEVKHFCSNAQTYNISKSKERKLPTIRIRGPSDDELAGPNDTALLCLIDGFLPSDISVHWELDKTKLDASRFTNSPVRFVSGSYVMQSALILSPLKKENGTFSCVVRHQSSTDPIKSEISNIYASVNENPPSVKLLQSQDELVCLADGYSPSAIKITWLLDQKPVENNAISSSAKGPDGKFMIKSHLNVKTSQWEPGSTYTCLVQHITGSVSLNVSKAEFIEKAIYIDDNKSDINTVDQAEETWNMACAFIILFVISLIYGCSITLVKVKTA